jgi:hypothetical protein
MDELTELERARLALGTQHWQNRDLRRVFGCGQTRAGDLARAWKQAGHITEVARHTYQFTSTRTEPAATERLSSPTQTVRQVNAVTEASTRASPRVPFAWLLAVLAALVAGGSLGGWLAADSQAASAPAPAVTTEATVQAAIAAARAELAVTPASAVDGPQLERAVIGCWEPDGADCVALAPGTRYTARQRQGDAVRLELPGGGMLWVATADLAGIPADLPVVPLTAPTATPIWLAVEPTPPASAPLQAPTAAPVASPMLVAPTVDAAVAAEKGKAPVLRKDR